MTHPYRQHTDRRETAQDTALPGQVPNSAGGHAWPVDDWTRLQRFLILGAQEGTYYIGERQLVRENADAVERCLAADPKRTVDEIVAVSLSGRAPKNDPALFALAMAIGSREPATRKLAERALPHVARTGTHLFQFAGFAEGFRGWGRSLRRAVATWYLEPSVGAIALQVAKYKERGGWSHRDLLRLAHVSSEDPARAAVLRYAAGKGLSDAAPALLVADVAAKRMGKAQLCETIRRQRLPFECVPSEALTDASVWEALLESMPMGAMLRNLGRMTSIGLLRPMAEATWTVTQRLQEESRLTAARIHPLAILLASSTYATGHGLRGSLSWAPVADVLDALHGAFYLSFGSAQKTGRRIVIGLDVSGSMKVSQIAGSFLSARVAAASMALVTKRLEERCAIVAFSDTMVPVTISPQERVDDVIAKTERLPFGRTDCAQPMLWALENEVEADAFLIYTDSETWCGSIHPAQALVRYRERTGIPARLAIVGMTSNGFSIADPRDGGMLDVVGFDTASPGVLADFVQGRL